MATRSNPMLGVAVVATAAAMFGMLAPVSRFSYDQGLTPFAFITWRSLMGMLATGSYVAWRLGGRSNPGPRPRLGTRAGLALLAAAVGGFAVNIGMFLAFQLVSVALVLLVFYTYPALVTVVAVALRREQLDRTRTVALGLSLLGMVAVVAAPGGDSNAVRPFDMAGLALALLAALGQTLFVTVSLGFRQVPTDVSMTAILGFIAAAGAVAAGIVGGWADLALPVGRPGLLALLVFAGLFTAAIPSLGLLFGIRLIGGVRTGILMLIEPVVGVVLAALLLAEPLRPVQLLGGLCVLAAAVILARAPLESHGRPASHTAAIREPRGP